MRTIAVKKKLAGTLRTNEAMAMIIAREWGSSETSWVPPTKMEGADPTMTETVGPRSRTTAVRIANFAVATGVGKKTMIREEGGAVTTKTEVEEIDLTMPIAGTDQLVERTTALVKLRKTEPKKMDSTEMVQGVGITDATAEVLEMVLKIELREDGVDLAIECKILEGMMQMAGIDEDPGRTTIGERKTAKDAGLLPPPQVTAATAVTVAAKIAEETRQNAVDPILQITNLANY